MFKKDCKYSILDVFLHSCLVYQIHKQKLPLTKPGLLNFIHLVYRSVYLSMNLPECNFKGEIMDRKLPIGELF